MITITMARRNGTLFETTSNPSTTGPCACVLWRQDFFYEPVAGLSRSPFGFGFVFGVFKVSEVQGVPSTAWLVLPPGEALRTKALDTVLRVPNVWAAREDKADQKYRTPA